MKTKNILKIGVFSIVLFALLISPILKFTTLETNAAELPDDPVLIQYCNDNSTMTLENNAQKQEYLEKCCDPGYDWGDDQVQVQQDAKCETLSGGVELMSTMGSEDLTMSLEQENASVICQEISYDAVMNACAAEHEGNAIYINTICKAKASLARTQCEIVTGTLEGLGVMFGGMINSEIEWILRALDPATYGGIISDGINAIWTILRNIVNSLLVLGLIGIAIATILGYKKYAWKQILWKLILVALLVNFSLVISGIVVETSTYLTGYFLHMSQNNGSIAPRIMTGYGYTKDATTDQYTPPKLLGGDKYKASQINQDEVAKKGVSEFTVGLGNALIIAFIMILTGGFAVIALLAIFLTIIVRNVVLIILMGFSSIAFAAWIFPDTEKYWKMWWSNFIKWCFFPVIFAFMLYLGLTVMDGMPPIDLNSSMYIIIIHMTLFSMFLVGGLIFSIQGAGVVSKTVMQQASKAGTAIGVGIAKRTTHGIEGSNPYRAAGQKLTQIPLLSNLGYNMLDKSDSARTIGDIKKREKEIEENRSKDQILNTANGMAPNRINKKSYADYMATRNVALKKGWLKNDDKAVGSIGRDIENNNPDLDAKIIRNAFPQFFRIGANGKAEKIDQTANDYQDQVVNNLKKMSPTDLPKNTEKIITAAGGDINKFLGKLVQLKTNQFRAFLDNVGENEYNQGEKVFGGTPANPKPFYGPNGEIVKRLKTEAATTLAAYSNVTNSNGTPTSASGLSQSDVDKLEQKWIEAEQVLTVLNDKLKTSDSLKETLGISKI